MMQNQIIDTDKGKIDIDESLNAMKFLIAV